MAKLLVTLNEIHHPAASEIAEIACDVCDTVTE